MRTTMQLRRTQRVQRRLSRLFSFIASGALSALLITTGACPVLAADNLSQEVDFDIPSQSLESALLEFSKQANVQVMVGASSLGPQRSNLLKGRQPASSALSRLLQNTGLVFEAIGNTVTIRADKPANKEASVRSLAFLDTALADARAAQQPVYRDTTKSEGQPIEAAPKNLETTDEIIVTGSNIRGEVSAGSQIQVLDRSDIDVTGYATIQEVLNTIPQNVSGGESEDFVRNGMGNFSRGFGINLRGLGSDATLVLINGHRQAGSGTGASFVDISSIPTSAVQKIELLTDGASAIYGSDAIGGVVNVVLRSDYDGAETRARLGAAQGDLRETQVSQIFGKRWSAGNVLLGYQYDEREALARADRAYTASADQRRFGGNDFRGITSNPGNVLTPGFVPAFAIPSGQDGSSLTAGDFLPGVVNRQSMFEGADLLPHTRINSAFLTATQRVNERLTINADGRYAQRKSEQKLLPYPAFFTVPSTNPFYVNPFGGSAPVRIAYSMIDDLGNSVSTGKTDTLSGTLGATLAFMQDWRGRLSASYAKESMDWTAANVPDFVALGAALADQNSATAFNPFGDGSHTNPATLDRIRTTQQEHSISDVFGATLIADGSMFNLPGGGTAKLAVGADYREQDLEHGTTNRRELGRSISAVFAELALPLIADEDAVDRQSQLALSIAARYENYSDFGTTVNPKVGIAWTPSPAIRVRGAWGTSFKAPRLVDLDESPVFNGASFASYVDPKSPTGNSLVLVRFGNNADLQEETATTWTAGVDIRLWDSTQPVLSLSYFDINYEDRILLGGPTANPTAILQQEAQWAALIRRNPSQSEVDEICNSSEYKGSIAQCSASLPAAILDFRVRNLGAVHVKGIDATVARQFATSLGTLGLSLNGNYLLSYETAATRQSPRFDVVDTVGNPPALRLRGALSWLLQEWSANISVNYMGSYKDNVSRPNRTVDSWTTLDLRLAYQTIANDGFFGNVELALSATNALDKDPPFYNSVNGYDTVNADLIGRIISAQITKSW